MALPATRGDGDTLERHRAPYDGDGQAMAAGLGRGPVDHLTGPQARGMQMNDAGMTVEGDPGDAAARRTLSDHRDRPADVAQLEGRSRDRTRDFLALPG